MKKQAVKGANVQVFSRSICPSAKGVDERVIIEDYCDTGKRVVGCNGVFDGKGIRGGCIRCTYYVPNRAYK